MIAGADRLKDVAVNTFQSISWLVACSHSDSDPFSISIEAEFP